MHDTLTPANISVTKGDKVGDTSNTGTCGDAVGNAVYWHLSMVRNWDKLEWRRHLLLQSLPFPGAEETSLPSSAESSPAPTPSPSSSRDAEATAYWNSCAELLDADTVAEFREQGLVPASADYPAKVAEESYPIGYFVKYGGLACGFKPEGGDLAVAHAYGPISDADADDWRNKLLRRGSELVEDSPYERYTDYDGYGGGFAFGDGYWAYTLDNGGGDVLDEVVANAPEF
ncbi:hypothetical protein QT381_12110 [Galbitalea sp. SE-J8]|uniref:hypothetical protein n=1 Tax=Galbitalea sp. SE-J8 TaxID=3054952 RepID=UPI00259C7F11|nr:hypothetical protein [Galbitalea sp. SE-J8]MDM4763752.1 hypothetical protein [Galbitalea sp. SE-J8]